jgi:type IV secretory pathway TraG/TraD family ATPase VirD4
VTTKSNPTAGGAIVAAPRYKVTRSRGMGLDGTTLALGGVLCLSVGAAAATQVVAHSFAYHQNLGPPLARANPAEAWAGVVLFGVVAAAGAVTRRGVGLVAFAVAVALLCFAAAHGPLYAPTDFFRWVSDYRGNPELVSILTRGWIALGAGSALVCGAAAIFVNGVGEKAVSTSHGSAAWGSGEHLAMTAKEKRHFWKKGDGGKAKGIRSLVIGKLPDGRLLLYRGEGHLITTAMTRSGKGVGCVIPNTLLYGGSMVINDLKAEIFYVTHEKRKRMGQAVYVLDGFGVTTSMAGASEISKEYLASANPLDMISYEQEDALDVARMIAGMIIPDDEGPNRHFSDEAKGIYAGFLIYACFI